MRVKGLTDLIAGADSLEDRRGLATDHRKKEGYRTEASASAVIWSGLKKLRKAGNQENTWRRSSASCYKRARVNKGKGGEGERTCFLSACMAAS